MIHQKFLSKPQRRSPAGDFVLPPFQDRKPQQGWRVTRGIGQNRKLLLHLVSNCITSYNPSRPVRSRMRTRLADGLLFFFCAALDRHSPRLCTDGGKSPLSSSQVQLPYSVLKTRPHLSVPGAGFLPVSALKPSFRGTSRAFSFARSSMFLLVRCTALLFPLFRA